MRWAWGLIAALCLWTGCGGGAASVPSAPSGASSTAAPPPAPPAPAPPRTPVVPAVNHVVIVIFENESYEQVIGSASLPYFNSLVAQYALATNYYADAHSSLSDYFMITTGQIIGNNTFTGTVTDDHVVRQLTAAGKTWKCYAESLPSSGYVGGDVVPYVKRHNPF